MRLSLCSPSLIPDNIPPDLSFINPGEIQAFSSRSGLRSTYHVRHHPALIFSLQTAGAVTFTTSDLHPHLRQENLISPYQKFLVSLVPPATLDLVYRDNDSIYFFFKSRSTCLVLRKSSTSLYGMEKTANLILLACFASSQSLSGSNVESW